MQRSYRQNCALAHSLDLLGERWTLLIIRELLIAPRRYSELLENLAGIGTNLLADRLSSLEERGLIEKSGPYYELTGLGKRLEPVIHELVRFGLALGIEDDPGRLTRPAWDIVALQAMYRPDIGAGLNDRYIIELDGNPFCIDMTGADPKINISDSSQVRAKVILAKALARKLANGEIDFDKSIRRGSMQIRGAKREAKKLLRSFGILS